MAPGAEPHPWPGPGRAAPPALAARRPLAGLVFAFLALFGGGNALAQSCPAITDLWCATMTVGFGIDVHGDSYAGYDADGSGAVYLGLDAGSLQPDRFTHDGVEYTVDFLHNSPSTRVLALGVSPALPAARSGLVLHLDTVALALSDAVDDGENGLQWDDRARKSLHVVDAQDLWPYFSTVAVRLAAAVTVPGAPIGLAADVAAGAVTLGWTRPSDGGAALTGYQYRVSADGGMTWSPGWSTIPGGGPGTVSHEVTGLTSDTAYTFEVRAVNGRGAGPAARVDATPHAPRVPDAPGDLRAIARDGAVTLAWNPAYSGNGPLTGYEYRVSADGGMSWSPDWSTILGGGAGSVSHEVTGLGNDTAYIFEVRAVNGRGEGPAARTSATPSATAPVPAVTVSFAAASYRAFEGDPGRPATVAVRLSEEPWREVVVPLTAAGAGGATEDDWEAPPSVTFAATETSKTFELTAGDASSGYGYDPGESVLLGFGTLPEAVAPGTRATATVHLHNDEAVPVEFSLEVPDDRTVSEGGGEYTIVGRTLGNEPSLVSHYITLVVTNTDIAATATLNINTSSAGVGSFRLDPSDYFQDGEVYVNRKTVTFTSEGWGNFWWRVRDDEIAEGDEYFTQVFRIKSQDRYIGPDKRYRYAGPQSFRLTLAEDDFAPVVGATRFDFPAAPGATEVATLAATDGDLEDAVGGALAWSIRGGADRRRFDLTSAGVLAFKTAPDLADPGDADGDGVYELEVRVTDGYNPVDADLEVRVLTAVTIASDDGTVLENDGAAGFTLRRTGPTAAALEVTVAVTQEADRDLLPDGAAAERTVTFAADSATAALTVALENDELSERGGTLTVAVQAGAGYAVGDPGSATVAVLDTDAGRPTPANLNALPGAVGEVVLSWDPHAPHLAFTRHQYRYKTGGGYGSWTDIPNSGQHDALQGDGSNLTGYAVTGLVGGRRHTFQVRTFHSQASSDASNEAAATPLPAAVSFAAATYTVAEGGTVAVTVSLDGAPGRELTVPVSAAGAGGATAPGQSGADWFEVARNVTFTAGATATSFTLAATQDTVDDDGESVTLTFGTLPDGVTAGTPARATVTIIDDDDNNAPVIVTASPVAVAENTTVVATLEASDVDDDAITWSQTGGADADRFALSPAGVLTFVAAPDYESPADLASTDPPNGATNNEYVVFVTAGDGTDNTELQLVVTVTNADEGQSGTVTIGDTTPTLGDELTASIANQADPDGLPDPFAFSWQWYRTPADGSETVIAGARSASYTVVTADLRAALTAKARWTDRGGFANTLASVPTSAVAPVPQLSVADAKATEGTDVSFEVSLLEAAADDVTATWTATVAPGDTAEGEDFANLSAATGTLTIAEGRRTARVRVATVDDTLDEKDDTFTLTLSNPLPNAEISDATASGMIQDDDAAPTLGIRARTVNEGDQDPDGLLAAGESGFPLTVTLSALTEKRVRYQVRRVAVETDTAVEADLASPGAAFRVFPAGEIEDRYPARYVADDALDEDDETFTLEIHALENATAGARSRATITIEDDDPEPSLSVADATATEGESAAFAVTLEPASGKSVQVEWTASVEGDDSATSGTDFTAHSATLEFEPGETRQTAAVATVADDARDEDDETFTLALSDAINASISDATATGTIVNDPRPAVGFTSDSTIILEEAGAVEVEVKLDSAATVPITVDWATVESSGDEAEANVDYTAASGTLTFAAGDTKKTITVAIIDDDVLEALDEFTVRLSGTDDTLVTLGESSTVVRIFDRDTATISVAEQTTVDEDAGTVALTLSASASAAASVEMRFAYRTRDGTAHAGADYTAASRPVRFPARATEHTITIAVLEDTADEDREDFEVELVPDPDDRDRRLTLPADPARVLIDDNDDPPALGVLDATAMEGDAVGFAVTLSPASGKTVTVEWESSIGSGTAEAGDFTAGTGTLTFAPGAFERIAAVTTAGDADADDETFTLALSNPVNATLAAADATATGRIAEGVVGPVLRALAVRRGSADLPLAPAFAPDTARYAVTVAHHVATVTVAATAGDAANATVAYLDRNGAAIADADATAAGRQVALAVGDNAITVRVTGDDTTMVDYTVTVKRADPPLVTVAADASTPVNERDGAAGFTLSRTGSTALALPVTVRVTEQTDRDFLPDGAAAKRTVIFAAGSATAALTVALEDDDLFEAAGELTVELQAGTDYAVGSPASATVTVVDADRGLPAPADLEASPGARTGEVELSWEEYAPHLAFDRHQYRYRTGGDYRTAWTDIPDSGQETADAGDGTNLTGYAVTGLVVGPAYTFQVRTLRPGNAGDPSNEATATPAPAAVSFGRATYPVGEGGTVEVTVRLDGAPGRTVVVPIAAATAGGATGQDEAGADYSGVPAAVTFGAAETEKRFTVTAPADMDVEDGESLTLSFGTLPDGVTAGSPRQAAVTIGDDDDVPALWFHASAVAIEDSARARVRLLLDRPKLRPIVVHWETGDASPVSAVAGVDYEAGSGTVTFASGETEQSFDIPVIDDMRLEDTEKFTVTLRPADDTLVRLVTSSSDCPAATGDCASPRTYTIVDVDDGDLSIDVETVVAESAGSATITVFVGDVPIDFAFEVKYETAPGTTVPEDLADTTEAAARRYAAAAAGEDYTHTTGTLRFRPGVPRQTITVPIFDDGADEERELFQVWLRRPKELDRRIRLPGRPGRVVIDDDDGPPALSVADARAVEGAGVPFMVTLSAAAAADVTASWTATVERGDTAKFDDFEDLSAATGTLTVTAGRTAATVTVATQADANDEDDETFTVTLSNPSSNAKISRVIAAGTIEDDDGVPSLSVADAAAREGRNVEFTVSLSAQSVREVTVDWATSVETGDAAVSGTDFRAGSGTLTFDPGETEQTVSVSTRQDSTDEPAETFTLTLTLPLPEETDETIPDAPNATISDATAKGTIEDDDLPVVTIARDGSPVDEDDGAGFTLSRTGLTAAALTVTVEVTQQEDRDLLPDGAQARPTVRFAVGDATAALSVALEDDDLAEEPGDLTVEVQGGTDYRVGSPASATVSVVDTDRGRPAPANLRASPGAEIGEVALAWDPHAAHLTFTRHQYRYRTDGSYGDWADIPDSGLNNLFGGTGANLTGYTVAGLVAGQSYTFQVRTFHSTGAGGASNEAPATPRATAVSFAAATYTVAEGGTVEVTVSLDIAPGREVTVTVSAAPAGGATAPGETGADWSGVPRQVTFGATDTERTFTVAATQDPVDDDGESMTLSFGTLPPGVQAGTPFEATVSITDDDDPPALSIGDAEAAEGDGVAFTVTLADAEAAAADVTVTWTASLATDDTAETGDFTDLSAATGTLTFSATQATATVTVATEEDTTDEEDETFTVTLSSPSSNARIADATAQGTIEDDDAAPTISVQDQRVIEDNQDPDDLAGIGFPLRVTLSPASGKDVRFGVRRVKLATDTATDADVDSSAEIGRHLIPPGQVFVDLTHRHLINEDELDEPDETFTLEVYNLRHATAGAKTQSTITIEDDDDPPTLGVEDASATEGDAVEFTVEMAESGKQVTVAWAASAGTGDSATAGTDFTAAAGTLTFSPGTPGDTAKTVTVATAGDTTVEEAETFTLTLSSPANAGFAGGATEVTATGTIEDSMLPVLSVGDASATEGSAVALKVKLSVASEEQVTVDWAASKESGDTADAGTDFTAVAATALTFTAGDTEQTVTVATALDALDEEDETFTVRLSNPTNATLASNPTATGTIDDDNDPPVMSVEAATALEGEDVEFTVTLDPASGREVTVDWDAIAETGDSAGTDDFTEVDTRPLSFTAGDTEQTVTVATALDTLDEEDETFTLTLSSPENAGFAGDVSQITAQGTIEDDDPEPTLSVDDSSAAEGEGVEFTVKLSPASGKQVTVDWATSVATGDTAVSGTDFTAANGTLTFAAGDEQKRLTVSTTEDGTEEEDETFTLTLSGAANAGFAGDATTVTATGRIDDDDGLPDLGVAAAAADEGDGVEFTVTLSEAADTDVTVTWTASLATDDTAETGDFTDLSAATGTLTFSASASQTTATFTVATEEDSSDEEDETFTVTLSSPSSNAELGSGASAQGTIRDDDDAPAVSFGAATYAVDEGGSVEVAVVLSAASGRPEVEVPLAHAAAGGATAQGGTNPDYGGVPRSVTFAAGERERTFTIEAPADAYAESGEGVALSFGTLPDGAVAGGEPAAAVSLNDVAVTVSFGAASYTAAEGGSNVAVTLTLDPPVSHLLRVMMVA